MGFFKPKNKLDSKSKQISVMYLYKAKTQLENELNSNERVGNNEVFTAEHDIRCLEKSIAFLED